MPSHPERYLVAALGFAVPAVWAGLGAATAVACVLAAAAAYASGGAAWRSGLTRAKSRVEGLAAHRPERRPAAPARRPRPQPVVDEPSESAISSYGW